jgi:hypothetical protein
VKLYRSSGITIMDGEVVTFATGFDKPTGGAMSRPLALGPFRVTASRNAVMVHHASVLHDDEMAALLAALKAAWDCRTRLRQRGHLQPGLLYPAEVTEVPMGDRAGAEGGAA